MWRVGIRNLLGHKVRLLTTGLAVVIGVAFLTGTLVLRDTMKQTFDDLFAGVYANTDAFVRAKGEFEDPSGFGVQRARIDESILDEVLTVDGVADAQVDVSGYAQIVGKDGNLVGNPQYGPPTIGGNWSTVPELNGWKLLEGRAPAADDEVVLDRRTAELAGYRTGDRATVVVMGPPQEVRISGVAEFGGAGGSTGGASFVIFTTPAAQRFLGEPGKVDSVSVLGDAGTSQAALAARLERALPRNVEAITGKALTKENQDAIQKGLSVFNTFMLVFALVALLVGAYIVFNTFFITVAQRSHENALLRALGASRPQVRTSILVEAVVVGLVSSVLGVVAGVGVAAGLKALLAAVGVELPVRGLVITPTSALLALAAGWVITVAAALSPARKAGRVAPMEAMRATAAAQGGYGSHQRVEVGLAVLVLGGVVLAYGLYGNSSQALLIVGLAALLLFFGVTFLGRTIAMPLSRLIGWPIVETRGMPGQLARENAMRNPRRTAATASALMIGVGLVSFITVFAASTKASIGKTIDEQFLGDFAVTSPAMAGNGGLDPALADRLNQLPEVDVAGGIRVRAAEVAGTPVQLFAGDPEAFDIFEIGPLQGSPGDLGSDTIAVHEDMARKEGLALGDRVPVRFVNSGLHEFTVAMIYRERMPAGDWIMGTAAFDKYVAERFDFQVFVRKQAGVPAATAKAAVERVVRDYPGASVLDQTEYKADQAKFVDQMLGLVYALLALAIVIALLGIGNTLALSILERIRELGILRAVGMTRAQLRSSVRWESVIIAVQGSVLGLVVGMFLGWALVNALGDQGLSTLALPWASLVAVVGIGALAGVAAAVLPARRASRIDVLRAIGSVS